METLTHSPFPVDILCLDGHEGAKARRFTASCDWHSSHSPGFEHQAGMAAGHDEFLERAVSAVKE
jgi:hypothetical protein